MDNSEKIIFNNSFGTVSDKRVIINHKNGSEDILLSQISSVAFVRKQSVLLAVIFWSIGVALVIQIYRLSEVPGYLIIITLLVFLFCALVGIAYFIGNHQIRLSISGTAKKPIKVEMARTKEGREFSEAIRKQIIS